MYESKYTSLIAISVNEIGTDRIINGLHVFVQADNTAEVDRQISRLLQAMPKDGTCELSVNYVAD